MCDAHLELVSRLREPIDLWNCSDLKKKIG